MTLMKEWDKLAQQYNANQKMAQDFWTDYYMKEKAVYEQLLTQPVEAHTGTVAELAEKFGTTKHNVECNVLRGDNGRISGRRFIRVLNDG